jgi:hypothetical protein
MTRAVLISLLLSPVAAAACGAAGAMHQATLAGQCAESDAACAKRNPLAPLAVGARFYPEVAADAAGTAVPSLRLESAAPDVIAVDGDALVAHAPGASAVLITTDDGSVVDFIHVWAEPVTSITLARRDGERVAGTVGLAVGEDLALVPTAWHGAQRLAGEVAGTWTMTGDAKLAMLPDGAGDRRRLRARAPGKTTVTVALGDAHASIDVEVVP